MRSTFGKYIPALFILIFFLTIGNIFLTYKNLLAVRENEKISDKTTQIKLTIKDLLLNLNDAETVQRNFLITANIQNLPLFNEDFRVIKDDLRMLETLTTKATIQKINTAVSTRETLLRQNMLLRQVQKPLDLISLIGKQASGSATRIEIKNNLLSLEKTEDQFLVKQNALAITSYQTVITSSALAGILNIILLVVAFSLTRSELVKRKALEKNKDEFISMASHELKTPITSLKVYTKVLANKLDKNETVNARHYISKIETQTQKLTSLVIDLLDMSRIKTGKLKIDKKTFNLDALIDETVEAIQGSTNKHTITTSGDIQRMVEGDNYRIYQVLINLLTNAIKYSPNGGNILVHTKVDKHFAVVSVQDSGIGIDKKYQNRIFDRLYQVNEPTEKTFPGLGIGLYVTAEIVKLHGGKIWVESEKGKGSTFYFTVPISEYPKATTN